MAVGITCPFIPHSRRASSSDEVHFQRPRSSHPSRQPPSHDRRIGLKKGSAGKLTLPLCGEACQSPLVANHRRGYIKGALSRAMPRGRKPWQSRRHEKMRCNRFRGRTIALFTYGHSECQVRNPKASPLIPQPLNIKNGSAGRCRNTTPRSGEYHRLTGR